MKEKLCETQKKIIEEIKKNPKVTQWELSIKLDRNERNIRGHMRMLKFLGILRRVGPCYNSIDRRWEILKEDL